MSLNTILATAPLTATGYHLKATGTALGQSLIWDNGTNVGIGNTNTSYTLDVSGSGRYLSGNEALRLDTTSTAFDTSIRFYNNNSATYWGGIQAGPAAISGGGMNIYNNGAYPMAFNVNGAERMRISSAGNVGIGTASPTQALQIGDGTASKYIRIAGAITNTFLGADSVGTYLGNDSAYPIYIATNGTERMRITSGGNVGIGTSSPTNKLQIGTMTVPYSGNEFAIGNGTVDYAIDVSATSVDMYSSAAMSFATSTTERMRITSGGQIVMGRTTPSGSGRLTVDGDLYLHNITSGAGQSTLKYNYTSTGLVTYDTSSRLLKKDIENLGYGLDDVLKMSAKKYKWKRDDSIDLGFIADEMVQIIPEIVFFSTEMTNETTGVPIGEPLSINYDRLIPVLVNAIQELSAQNQDLKSRLDKAGL